MKILLVISLFYKLNTATTINTAIINYFAVPGVGRHEVIKPQPRTVLTIFRDYVLFSIGTEFIEHCVSIEH